MSTTIEWLDRIGVLARSWLCACALAIGFGSSARAETAARLVFLRADESPSRLVQRLRGELAGLGVEVIEETDVETTDPIKVMTDVAGRTGAFAVVRVVSSSAGMTVWVADRATGTTLVRTLAPADPPVRAEIIAIQAVELVRASLIEAQRPRPEPKAQPREATGQDVPVLVDRPSDRQARAGGRIRIELGPAVLHGSSTLGPSAYARGAIGYRWTERFAARAFVLLPFTSSTLEGSEGSAQVRATLAGVAGDIDLLSPAYAWIPRLGAEIAVVQFHTTGTAQQPFTSQDHTVYAAMPIVRATLVGRLTSRIGVTADMFGGVSLPRPFVTFGERRVAVWGRPLIGAGIGMQLEID